MLILHLSNCLCCQIYMYVVHLTRLLSLQTLVTLCRCSKTTKYSCKLADAAVPVFSSELVPTVAHPVGHRCTAEPSFSCLRRLKTLLLSVLSQQKLNHIALLHCHGDQTVDFAKICNTFTVKYEMRQ